MKKLLILGGGSSQLSAVRRAKELGCYTIVADYLAQPPAAALADRHVRVSTFDVPGCLAVAQETGADGVLTLGTDQPLYTAAVISETLGLPFPLTAAAAQNATDKQRMKAVFQAAGLPNTRHAFLQRGQGPEVLAGLKPPLVLKPVDSQGQRGIFKLDSAEAAVARLEETLAFSRRDTALVEEYYPNEEITVNGWVAEGRLQILAVTDRLSLASPNALGVCYGHRYPSKHLALYEQIRDLSQAITAAFSVREGPAYYQLLYGAKGLLVNEIAFRLGGAYEDVIIPRISGFSTVDGVLAQALGQKPDLSPLAGYDASQGDYAGLVQLMFCSSGRIGAITPLPRLLALPGVLAAGYNYRVGDLIPETLNATARFGYCVMLGRADQRQALNRAFWQAFQVRDEAGQELAQEYFI